MARFIIQNKVYDTDKMEFISVVEKWYKFEGYFLKQMFGEEMGRRYMRDLYRSPKGNYLLVHTNDCDQLVGQAITENEAKELLLRSNYDVYAKLYGELKEA